MPHHPGASTEERARPWPVGAALHWAFLARRRFEDLLGGLLLVPGALLVALAVLGVVLVAFELTAGADARLERGADQLAVSPDAVRTILVAMGGSLTAAVAMLFSTLLVVQTLASTQFSPRVLGSLVDDRTSQITLGALLGSVVLCFVVLLAVRDSPPFVPATAIGGAALAFLVSLALLVNFIHHVSRIVQINYIVERVADRTLDAIDWALPEVLDAVADGPVLPPLPTDAATIESDRSGYVRSVDLRWLDEVARYHGVALRVVLPVGGFATRSVALVAVTPGAWSSPALAGKVLAAFDIGPVRSIRQDPDFGVRQLVDVAIKAISPAVNDPTTAHTCVQQLERVLVHAIGRRATASWPARVVLPQTDFPQLLYHAVAQVRQFSRRDYAVSVALFGLLRDLVLETHHGPYLDMLLLHASELRATREDAAFSPADLARIDGAWREVREAVEAQRRAAT